MANQSQVVSALEQVRQVEKQGRALMATMRAAKPALRLLDDVDYRGVRQDVWGEATDRLEWLLETLHDMRISAGDRGAYLYQFYRVRHRMTPAEAEEAVSEEGTESDLRDLAALRAYSRSLGS